MQRRNGHRSDISLKTQISFQITNANWTPKSSLLELIDNSIDAGASRISIDVNGSSVCVRDNGCGTDIPYVILEPHNREDSHGGKGTGQFGIGGAYAMIYMTNVGRVEAISVKDGIERSAFADWGRLDEMETQFPTRVLRPDKPTGQESGTLVTMHGVPASRRSRTVMQSVASELGILYKPGVSNGLEIVVDGDSVVPPLMPLMSVPVVSEDIVLSCGMRFTASMGLLHANTTGSCNRVYYGPRQMECGPDLLASVRTNTSRLWFEVQLYPDECRKHGLKVTPTKESLVTHDETVNILVEEMRQAVLDRFSEIVKSAGEQVQSFKLTFMSNMISQAVKGALSHKDALRPVRVKSVESSRGSASGSRDPRVEPTNVDPNELGHEDAQEGEFSIGFRLEPTGGESPAIKIDCVGSEIVVRVNMDKTMGRTNDQMIEWILGAIPYALVTWKSESNSKIRDAKIEQLVAVNPDWQKLLHGPQAKPPGLCKSENLVELFNQVRHQVVSAMSQKFLASY